MTNNSTISTRQDPTTVLADVFGRPDLAAGFSTICGGQHRNTDLLDGLEPVPGRCDRDILNDVTLDDATRFAAKVRLGLTAA